MEDSDIIKQILESCPNTYINKYGQVIDPCHVWFSNVQDATNWDVEE